MKERKSDFPMSTPSFFHSFALLLIQYENTNIRSNE